MREKYWDNIFFSKNQKMIVSYSQQRAKKIDIQEQKIMRN